MSGKQKSFKELYKELKTAEDKLIESQKRTQELQEGLTESINNEIVKIFRAKYNSDTELVKIIQRIQSGDIKLELIENPQIMEQISVTEGDES